MLEGETQPPAMSVLRNSAIRDRFPAVSRQLGRVTQDMCLIPHRCDGVMTFAINLSCRAQEAICLRSTIFITCHHLERLQSTFVKLLLRNFRPRAC
jgi:hypothetical protein